MNTSGGAVQLLVGALDGRLGSASLAPDGSWVVSRTADDDTGFSIIAAAGGPARALIPVGMTDSLVGWSADGLHVLFVSRQGASNDLVAVRVVQGQPVDRPFLIRTLQSFSSLGLSKAGVLLYQSSQGQTAYLYRASLDATSGRVGPPSSVDLSTGHLSGSVSWSPDGRRLAYVSWPDGRPARMLSIWSVETGGTRSFSLSFNAQRWSWLPTTWSADGRWVYLAESDDAGRQGVHRIDTGSGADEIVLSPTFGMFLAGDIHRIPSLSLAGWSPDARVLYRNEWTKSRQPAESSFATLVEHRLADRAERRLFATVGPDSKVSGFAVSSDGSQLAFVVIDRAAGKIALMVMPAAGGPAKTIAELPTAVEGGVRWTHDGRCVVLTLRGYAPGRLLCDVTTRAVTTLTLASDWVEDIAVAPDGRQIAYVGGREGRDEGVWLLENFLPATPGKAAPTKR